MGRRWFASSALGLGVAGSLLVTSVLPAAVSRADEGGGTPPVAIALTPPSPSAQLDQNFLLLPAYDLEWTKPGAPVKVGDTLQAKIEGPDLARLPRDLKIQTPPGTADETDLGYDISDSVTPSGDDLVASVTITKAGHVQIPSLALVDSSGKPIARTNPVSIESQSTIAPNDPKAKEPVPPKPPVSLGLPVTTLVLIGILILAAITGLVVWIVRWSRARRAAIPAFIEPPKPEDEVALASLAQLEKRALMSTGRFKAHYFAISEILKRYVGARYGFEASESTTEEMFSFLRENRGMPAPAMESLGQMFEKLDLVKFTDHVPVSLEGAELLQDARKIVLTTRRPPPVVNPGPTPKTKETGHAAR